MKVKAKKVEKVTLVLSKEEAAALFYSMEPSGVAGQSRREIATNIESKLGEIIEHF